MDLSALGMPTAEEWIWEFAGCWAEGALGGSLV